ncbi:hypothetical protein BSKO_07237 [Bryopsis sp. KO-2023]|nr:hypothetical protein BSKO_07237 [Bryopsis sp. KO-2023]
MDNTSLSPSRGSNVSLPQNLMGNIFGSAEGSYPTNLRNEPTFISAEELTSQDVVGNFSFDRGQYSLGDQDFQAVGVAWVPPQPVVEGQNQDAEGTVFSCLSCLLIVSSGRSTLTRKEGWQIWPLGLDQEGRPIEGTTAAFHWLILVVLNYLDAFTLAMGSCGQETCRYSFVCATGQFSTDVIDLLCGDLNERESDVVGLETLGGVQSHENFPPRELIMGVRWFLFPTGVVKALMKFPVLSVPQQVAAVKAGAEFFVGQLNHQGGIAFNGINANIPQPVAGSDGWGVAVRQSDRRSEKVVSNFFGVRRIRQALWWSSKQPEVRPGVEKSTWKKDDTINQYVNEAVALYIVLKPEVGTTLHVFEGGELQATREKGIGFYELGKRKRRRIC